MELLCPQCSETKQVPEGSRRRLCLDCSHSNQLRAKRNYNGRYKKENKQEISRYNKSYFASNSETIKVRRHGYITEYHARNPHAKLHHNMRGRMRKILQDQRGDYSSRELLGCNKQMFKDWLEFQFQFNPEFTFENYGEVWHMDHCIPCSKFDKDDEKSVQKCFHWSNIKPMDPVENNSKNDTTSRGEQFLQWFRAKAFMYYNSHKYPRNTYTYTPLTHFTYIQ